MPEHRNVRFVLANGPRPPFYAVGEHLWGASADLDSDGNSSSPDATDWTELTLINRRDPSKRVDVDPESEAPLVLRVEGTTAELADRTAQYLAAVCKGNVVQR
jgi:hypothetical protein